VKAITFQSGMTNR